MAKNPYAHIKDPKTLEEVRKKLWPIPESKCCGKKLVFEHPQDTVMCRGCGRTHRLVVKVEILEEE